MILSQLKLRPKLLLLLLVTGGLGLVAFATVILVADHQLFNRFVPENRALRDVESRSARLLQNYYRFMLTPEIINIEVLDDELVLIRRELDNYQNLVNSVPAKKQLSTDIRDAISRLEAAGHEMTGARQSFRLIFIQQQQLEEEIQQVFDAYRKAISLDIGRSIESGSWNKLVRDYLPELRMADQIHQQFLLLFLRIREYQGNTDGDVSAEIRKMSETIKFSSTLLEIYVSNSDKKGQLSAQILTIYESMLEVVDAFTLARQKSKFAVSLAEQSGIDLNESIVNAIAISDSAGWQDLRSALFLAGATLILTLAVSYLLIYGGLNRILKPLESLQAVIGRLGRGDFKQRSRDVSRQDEIGQLATEFNRMADQLEDNAIQKQYFIEQLEQKNMELERFTYTVSHELKSPLVTVSVFLGLLNRDLGGDMSERVQKDMLQIESAINTMSKQLEDLLDLSRIGRVSNPPLPFEFGLACREALESLQGLLDKSGAIVNIVDDMPMVEADQVRVREVLQNLIENAVKFTLPYRQPEIRLSAKEDGNKVICRVCDNGPGIDPHYHDKVFELFDRLDSEVPGTGIGLALVKRIIEIHGGNIWIESSAGESGCCFVFELPAVTSQLS